MRAVRASGPGGQNVNKVASKVELHVDLGQVVGLDEASGGRLRALPAARFDADGRLLCTSQRFRDQSRNLRDAREKVRALLQAALAAPVPRRPTRPGRGSVERRLQEKRRQAARKQRRRGGEDERP